MFRFTATSMLTVLLAVQLCICAEQCVSGNHIYNADVIQMEDKRCDLSGKFLTHIPDSLPQSCTILDLSNNLLNHVSGYAFSSLGSTLLSLNLSSNLIPSLNEHAFANLSALTCLDLSRNGYLGLYAAFTSLYGLQNRTMARISFDKVNTFNTNPANIIISKDMLAHFAEMCVNAIDLSGNNIAYVAPEALLSLKHPMCLQQLILRGQVSTQSFFPFYKCLLQFENLTDLDISNAYICDKDNRMAISPVKSVPRPDQIVIRLPRSLERFTAISVFQGTTLGDDRPRVIGGHNLKFIDLSYNDIKGCSYSIEGLTNLRVLNVSGLYLANLRPVTCLNYSTLEVFVAREAYLDRAFSNELARYTFANEVNLQYVDLSNNNFYDLPEQLFQFNKHLHTVILSSNKLRKIPEAILDIARLQQLDLSYNVIVALSKKERLFLDRSASENKSRFLLNINWNPLTCTCSSFDSIEWLLTTQVHIQNLCGLKCNLENGTQTSVCSLRTDLRSMQISCTSKLWLKIGLTSCIIVVLILSAIAIIYRNRRRIQYYLYSRCARVPPDTTPVDQYAFDVFISFCSDDYQWVINELVHFLTSKNFQICLHHKDFVPGDLISENIVRSVTNCRKTILVISRKFASAPWCRYEIEMVNMRSLDEGRDDVAVPILLEDVPMSEMPSTLQRFWRKVGFLVWNDNPVERQQFWDRLKRVLRD